MSGVAITDMSGMLFGCKLQAKSSIEIVYDINRICFFIFISF
jgi:hypothetical protein